MSITHETLIRRCEEYKKREGRASYDDIALEIVRK